MGWSSAQGLSLRPPLILNKSRLSMATNEMNWVQDHDSLLCLDLQEKSGLCTLPFMCFWHLRQSRVIVLPTIRRTIIWTADTAHPVPCLKFRANSEVITRHWCMHIVNFRWCWPCCFNLPYVVFSPTVRLLVVIPPDLRMSHNYYCKNNPIK